MKALTLCLLIPSLAFGCAGLLLPYAPKHVVLYRGAQVHLQFRRVLESLRKGDTVEFGDGKKIELGEKLSGTEYGVEFLLNDFETLLIPFLWNEPESRADLDDYRTNGIRVKGTGPYMVRTYELFLEHGTPVRQLRRVGFRKQFLVLERLPESLVSA